jgi:hypothetical protein
MAKMLRSDLRKADLPDEYEGRWPYTAHSTRRSFCTWLGEAGVAEGTIKKLMGHAGAGVTQVHYTNKSLEILQAAVESIKLNLSTAQIITLPVRKVANGETPSEAPSDGKRFPSEPPPDPLKETPQAGTCTDLFTDPLPTRVGKRAQKVERDTGFEPATSSLGSWHSTN